VFQHGAECSARGERHAADARRDERCLHGREGRRRVQDHDDEAEHPCQGPNIDAAKFQELANAAVEGCPVSQVFKGNIKIELDAALT